MCLETHKGSCEHAIKRGDTIFYIVEAIKVVHINAKHLPTLSEKNHPLGFITINIVPLNMEEKKEKLWHGNIVLVLASVMKGFDICLIYRVKL